MSRGEWSESLEAIERFLGQFCARPDILRAAIEQTAHKWTVDKNPNEQICNQGDRADCCWLVVRGEVDIYKDGEFIITRRPGELIGEQAFLNGMAPKRENKRTASMFARGNIRLLCLNEAFIDNLEAEQKAEWYKTLAIVESIKLEEATEQRSTLQGTVAEKLNIIRRFADEESVSIANDSIESKELFKRRDAIIWFSDLAGFSTWAEARKEDEAAKLLKKLIGSQMEIVRKNGGLIDKSMGDGLMAFWFIDSVHSKKENPKRAFSAARKSIEEVIKIIGEEGIGEALDIRVGLHKGPVAYGDFGAAGRISVTLLGRAVNVAARYEQARSDNHEIGRLRFSPEFFEMMDDSEERSALKVVGPYRLKVKNTEIDLLSCEVCHELECKP